MLTTIFGPVFANSPRIRTTTVLQSSPAVAITSSVTDTQSKLPLAGVSVTLKESSQTSITDEKGAFSL